METIAQYPGSAHTSRGTPLASQACAMAGADGSKAYHATGEWGKRGMTFQELMRAFDAFNEAEERVAIGFAWSEDCSRKLEEPLKGVKTVFSDLDGLRPLCPTSDSPSLSSPSTTPVPSYQPSTLRRAFTPRSSDDFGHVMRIAEMEAPCTDINFGGISGHAPEASARADGDTIKPSFKRRRSLSVVSPPETPTPLVPEEEYTSSLQRVERAEDVSARPSSRLAFFDREIGDDDIFNHWT